MNCELEENLILNTLGLLEVSVIYLGMVSTLESLRQNMM